MVRQATGPNDHHTTPTFLQVYRILSSYSILKPPISANYTILQTEIPKITLTDIREVNESNESEKVIKIKKLTDKLDQISSAGMWEADDVFDHYYCNQTSVKDCVTYYICGYLSRQI